MIQALDIIFIYCICKKKIFCNMCLKLASQWCLRSSYWQMLQCSTPHLLPPAELVVTHLPAQLACLPSPCFPSGLSPPELHAQTTNCYCDTISCMSTAFHVENQTDLSPNLLQAQIPPFSVKSRSLPPSTGARNLGVTSPSQTLQFLSSKFMWKTPTSLHLLPLHSGPGRHHHLRLPCC